jgi:hypothetical protein
MKKFPPLHPFVLRGLPLMPEGDVAEAAPLVRAFFNADVDPRLGMLLLEIWQAADAIDGGTDPQRLAALSDQFGRCATAAAIVGDTGFFEQVIYLATHGAKAAQLDHRSKNLQAIGAHAMAQLLQGKARMNEAPPASVVARMIDHATGKAPGTTEAAGAVDLCARQAVSLPLAKGKRGPAKK